MTSTLFSNTATTGPAPGLYLNSFSLLPGGLAAFRGSGSSLTGNAGVYIYNFATGSMTLLVQGGPLTTAPGFGPASLGPSAIAALGNGKLLIASTGTPAGVEASNIYEVNPTTGAVTVIGSIPGFNVYDLAVARDGTGAYVETFQPGLDYAVARFDFGSATTTNIATGLFPSIQLAVVAPEPTSLALTALGICILTLVARHAQKPSRGDHISM
jgi:hypothetical protein